MSLCDEIRDWDDMTSNQRFMMVRERIKATAREWGLGDDVKVVRQPPPLHPDRRGGYDSDNDTIYLHPDLFRDHGNGWDYANDTAMHEVAHHFQDVVDDAYPVDPADEGDDPWDGWDGEMDDLDDDDMDDEGEDFVEVRDEGRHADAQGFADAWLDAAKEACADDPGGAESALKSFLEDWALGRGDAATSGEVGDWVLPPEGHTYG